MSDLEKEELEDFDLDQFNEELRYLDKYERETLAMEAEEQKQGANAWDYDSDENEMSRLDEDLDPEFREGANEETIQAMTYDRAFVTNGPVIKVFKNSEEVDKHQQKLKYMMHLPALKDPKHGGFFEPVNLLLHNNESSMLFIDKRDKNRMVNYDLESGKVVEEFDVTGKCNDGVKMVTNEFKNAQSTAA